MNLHANAKGISTIALILLILISAVIGGIISYAFTIAYYAKIPEETAITITGVHINPKNVKAFNITVLNPSYSPRSANITRIAISLKNGSQLYDVKETNPPITKGLEIRVGEAINITCLKIRKDNVNITFGEFVNTFAGEPILVHVFAEGSPAANIETTLPNVKIKIITNFDKQFSESVEYFNLTIENRQPEPLINLTISKVLVYYETVETEPPLPRILMPNQRETLVCKRNWEDLKWVKVKITVKTEEGYESTYTTDELIGAAIYVDEIKFDYDDASYINVTVSSSEYSTGTVYINKIELKLENEQPILLNTSYPANINITPVPLLPKQSVTFKCVWSWQPYRNKTIILTVYTKQGIKAQSNPFRTPSETLWEISDVNFDLDNLNFFMIKIANRLCSKNITITGVKLNDQNANVVNSSATILPGQQVTLNCSFSWRSLVNTTVTVSVSVVSEGNLQSTRSRMVRISPVKLSILEETFVFGEFTLSDSTITIPYVNVTVRNSNNSLLNVTVTKIVLTIFYEDGASSNRTVEIDGALTYPRLLPNGYVLLVNETVTFICVSDWSLYLTPNARSVTVTVYTIEGFQATRTWHR